MDYVSEFESSESLRSYEVRLRFYFSSAMAALHFNGLTYINRLVESKFKSRISVISEAPMQFNLRDTKAISSSGQG